MTDLSRPDQIVGANVRSAREALGMTQGALAQRLRELGWEIDATGVTRIEKGTRSVRVSQLHLLGLALGVTPGDLIVDEAGRIGATWAGVGRNLTAARVSLVSALTGLVELRDRLGWQDGAALMRGAALSIHDAEEVAPHWLAFARRIARTRDFQLELPFGYEWAEAELQPIVDAVVADVMRFALSADEEIALDEWSDEQGGS